MKTYIKTGTTVQESYSVLKTFTQAYNNARQVQADAFITSDGINCPTSVHACQYICHPIFLNL